MKASVWARTAAIVRMAMACVQHRDTSREVDVALAVHIPDFGILGPCDIEIFRRNAAGHGGFMAEPEGGCCAHGRLPVFTEQIVVVMELGFA